MKKFLSLLMALTMLMACTACFGSAESASDPAAYDGSEVNITFYNTMGSNLTPVLDTYIEEFNKLYPNIHVSYTSVGGYDDVRDQISKEITVGGPAQHRLLLPGSRCAVQPRACGAAAGCLH